MKSKIEKKVYDFFIKSNDFNGIPLRNISNDLGIEYQYSINLIKDLVADDIITIQSSTNPHIIYSRHYRVDDQLKILEEAKSWKVTAQKIGEVSLLSESTDYPICLYPSPNILKSKRDVLEFGNEIYSKELAYGQPQLKPVFFEIEVLERYYNDPRFDFKLKDYSGSIYCKYDENYKPFVREEDEVFLKTFGLGYNSDNKRVVVVYLRYLKDLTPEHQMYWKSKESKKECRMLEVYYQNTIKGSWASSYSIFSAFIGELKCLNEISNIIFSKPLFKEDFENTNRPKEFTFFFTPTSKNYNDFVHLLDKMLSENINRSFFEGKLELLDFIEIEEGVVERKNKGTLRLLEEWLLSNVEMESETALKDLLKPFKNIRRERQRPAHKIYENKYDVKFIELQKEMITNSYNSIRALRQIFEQHPEVADYNSPAWLDQDIIIL